MDAPWRFDRAEGRQSGQQLQQDTEWPHRSREAMRYVGSAVPEGFGNTRAAVSYRVGSGRRGQRDGVISDASVNRPYGLCAVPGSCGAVAFTDTHNNAIRFIVQQQQPQGRLELGSSAHPPDTTRVVLSLDATELLSPKGICASDNGRHLFVCDTGHHKIKFAALPADSALASVAERLAGVELFPFAGTGKKAWRDGPVHDCSFNAPAGICQCADGTLTVADTGNHCIRQIVRTPAGGLQVRTIAGGYVSVRDSNSEYVARPASASHAELPRLRTRIAGYRDGRHALFRSPSAVIEGHHGTLLVADTMNNCIRALRRSRDRRSLWSATTVCGAVSGGYVDGSCEVAAFRQPVGLSLGPHGSFFVSDRGNCCIRQVGGCVAQLSGRARDSVAYTWVRTIEIGVVPRSVLSASGAALAECTVERLGDPLGVLFTGSEGTSAALLVCDGGNNVIECLAFDDTLDAANAALRAENAHLRALLQRTFDEIQVVHGAFAQPNSSSRERLGTS